MPRERLQVNGNHKGFTLIELLITMAIVAILAAVAIPAYDSYVRKARRSEAFEALHQTINAMEKYRLSQNTYPATITVLDGVIRSHGLEPNGSAWESADGNYAMSIVSDAMGIRARAVAQNKQASDAAQCKTFQLFTTGQRSVFNGANANTTAECWPD